MKTHFAFFSQTTNNKQIRVRTGEVRPSGSAAIQFTLPGIHPGLSGIDKSGGYETVSF